MFLVPHPTPPHDIFLIYKILHRIVFLSALLQFLGVQAAGLVNDCRESYIGEESPKSRGGGGGLCTTNVIQLETGINIGS